MAFDPANSPLLTPIDIASTPSYGLPMTSNVTGNASYNTSVVWGGPGGTFQIITSGNLAQIAQLTTPGFIAIKTAGSDVVTAHITAGTGIGVTAVGDDFQVSVTPNTTTQRIIGQYNSTTVGVARNTVNLKAGVNTSVTLVDSGTSLDWTINAAAAAAVTAPYVITQAASALTGATNLGALSTGIVLSTVSSGVATLSTVSLGSYPTLGGTQTWTGVNTYSQPIVTSGASILPGTIATTAVSGTAMNLGSVQTVTAVKTFSAAPVLSGASITTGTIPIAAVTGTAVAISGAQTITGIKTFTPKTIFSASLQIPTGGGLGKVLGSDGSGNAAWQVAGAGDVTLAGANVFTGTNTFNTNLPTSTATPTTSTQLVTKTYVDTTFAPVNLAATVATTDATLTTIASIALAELACKTVTGTIVAASADYTNACGGTFTVTARRATGGNVTLANTPSVIVASTSSALFNATVDTGTQSILITVTGIAATTYNWSAKYVVQTV